MNNKRFFDEIRPAFGGSLSDPQVKGMDALLAAGRGLILHHMAHVLAHVRRETGDYMSPIKETVMPHHKNKNPTDAEVIRRLDYAWAKGRLKGVKAPYWRGGEFGRGQIQLTHAENRAKFGITNRDDLLKLEISARVAVEGMRDGKFRGLKLSDFNFPADLGAPPSKNPRRIVNGEDGSDREVAGYHREFASALKAAGWGTESSAPMPAPIVTKPKSGFLQWLLSLFNKGV